MTKLHTIQRRAIMDRLLNHFAQPRRDDLARRRLALAVRVRDLILGDKRDVFMSLPMEWVHHTNRVRVGKTDRYCDDDPELHLDETIRVPACMEARYASLFPDNLPDDVAAELRTITEDTTALSDEIYSLKKRTEAILRSFTTTDKLIEAWPEIEPFVNKDDLPPPAYPPPAIQIADLNIEFGLAPPLAANDALLVDGPATIGKKGKVIREEEDVSD